MKDEESDFKAFERQAWEEKATRYDNTWGKVSTQSIPAIVAHASSDMAALDIGCGPGHLCRALSHTTSTIIGCDYSHKMIELARKNYPNIQFQHEDAASLSFANNAFDFVTLNYLLLHVDNQESVLKEAKRVLRKGGTLVYTTWLSPAESQGLALMFAPVKAHADMSVIPPAQDIFTFADRIYAQEFLKEIGFGDIKIQILQTKWYVSGGEELFEAVQAGTRIGGTIDLQSESIKSKIKEEISANIEEFRTGSTYTIPTPSLLISAKREA